MRNAPCGITTICGPRPPLLHRIGEHLPRAEQAVMRGQVDALAQLAPPPDRRPARCAAASASWRARLVDAVRRASAPPGPRRAVRRRARCAASRCGRVRRRRGDSRAAPCAAMSSQRCGADVVVAVGGESRRGGSARSPTAAMPCVARRSPGRSSQCLAEMRQRAPPPPFVAEATGIERVLAEAVGFLRLVGAIQPCQEGAHLVVARRDRARDRGDLVRATQRQRVVVDAGQRRIALRDQRRQRRVASRRWTAASSGAWLRSARYSGIASLGAAEQAVFGQRGGGLGLEHLATLSSVTSTAGARHGGTGDTAWSALMVTIGVAPARAARIRRAPVARRSREHPAPASPRQSRADQPARHVRAIVLLPAT